MEIKLFSPFDKLAGEKNIVITTKEQFTVKDLINFLCLNYPQIKNFIGNMKIEDAVYWRLSIVRDGVLLKAEDKLRNEDKIFIITPIMGG
ncbi:MAG: MoaD/ThiS family protein [Thermovenabulum sp.]|uniref:MoaD/ThiS family protein n=1 Tax=Thermovenabulum sp. TaxID=3100335 RepID=UPI003C7DF644